MIIEHVPFGRQPLPPPDNTQRLREFLAKLAMYRDVRFNGQFTFQWKQPQEKLQ